MFKSVEFEGFDRYPERVAMAERIIPVLEGEIRTWRDDVIVSWRPGPTSTAPLILNLELTLSNGSSSSESGFIMADDVKEESRLRWKCRQIWGSLLDSLLGQLTKKLDAFIAQPLEV